jgi:hypothetical protein
VIHQANLIPPGLLSGPPEVYQPYLILREHVIDRLYDQNVGYWQPDLQGLDHLTSADRAELLVDYLGVSERQLVKTVERLAARGATRLLAWRENHNRFTMYACRWASEDRTRSRHRSGSRRPGWQRLPAIPFMSV